jgi:hypothetical protein
LNDGASTYSATSPWWVFERMQRLVAAAPAVAPWVREQLAPVQHRIFEDTYSTEEQAAEILETGDSIRARELLRALVDRTSTEAIAFVEGLTPEVRERAAESANAEMADFWNELNGAAGLPSAGASIA